MSISMALAEVGFEVCGMGWRGWRGKGKDFEFLRDHVENVKCVVSLKVDFGKVQRPQAGVVVFKGGGVFG